MKLQKAWLLVTLFTTSFVVQAQVKVKHIQTDNSAIATGVWADDTFYLSGQMASPSAPADPAKGIEAVYGDTKTQAGSVFAKIQKALQDQGLGMKDVVKMTVFLVGNAVTGKMDFVGMNSEYVKYFGTKDQPNKPARSTVEVAHLATPWGLVEVEVVAVRSR
jgi:enamine deaminase RidA (YjgF/YER057c/UK114 family)